MEVGEKRVRREVVNERSRLVVWVDRLRKKRMRMPMMARVLKDGIFFMVAKQLGWLR